MSSSDSTLDMVPTAEKEVAVNVQTQTVDDIVVETTMLVKSVSGMRNRGAS